MPSSDRRRPFRWRPWLRAAHRDVGYVLVGLTFVYALSGLAVNHLADWDPNFNSYEETIVLQATTLEGADEEVARRVISAAGLDGEPVDVFALDDELQITLDDAEIVVQRAEASALIRGRSPRFLLRVSNWLHLNRGKRAWTFIADAYAILLLGLAVSGMFMLPGKRGLRGRGALLVAAGVAVPVLYVALSGGP